MSLNLNASRIGATMSNTAGLKAPDKMKVDELAASLGDAIAARGNDPGPAVVDKSGATVDSIAGKPGDLLHVPSPVGNIVEEA